MTLCASPDCCTLISDGKMYCSDFCQRESRRIHGRTFHLSEIEHVAQRVKNATPYNRSNKADEGRRDIWDRAVDTLVRELKQRTIEAKASGVETLRAPPIPKGTGIRAGDIL